MGNDLYLKETIIKGILAPKAIFTQYGAYKALTGAMINSLVPYSLPLVGWLYRFM